MIQFRAEPAKPAPPPDDPIAGASWLSRLLRDELQGILTDPSLAASERRSLVLQYSKTIIAATPNHELYEARKVLREEESELKESKLRGEVTRAKASGARRIRADAPRR